MGIMSFFQLRAPYFKNPTLITTPILSVTEDSTVTENVTVFLPTLTVFVFDSSIITESFNSALSFNGSTAYVLLKSGTILAGLTNFTISGWVSTTSTGPIYSERAASGNDILKLEVDAGVGHIGELSLVYRDDAGTLNQVRSGKIINDGAMHHVVVTKSGTAISFYVDNISQTGGTLTATNTFTNASMETRVGADKGDSSVWWNGTIDDVSIYNAALSSGNVGNLYNHTYPTTISGCIGYWPFDEGSGTTTTDKAGSNNGTLSGSTTPTWRSGSKPQDGQTEVISLISLNETVLVRDTRTNYLMNPSFETNDLYWGLGGGSKSQSTSFYNTGKASLQFIASTTDDKVYATVSDGLPSPVVGKPYTFSAYLRGSGQLKLWVYDGSADQYSASLITLTSIWTRYSLTITCGGSGMLAGLRLTTTNAVTAYMDNAMFEEGSSADTYFDGGTWGAIWSGATDQSTSSTAIAGTTIVYRSPLATLNDPQRKAAIHTGSYSIDTANTLTQTDINKLVKAIATSIPNTDYIVVGSYLDYVAQIRMWIYAIRAAGKKVWIRSAGYNDWRGSNGITQYTSADFASHSTTQYVSFINTNYDIFQAGDIFETVPDEPENNSMWNTTYGTIGSGTGLTAYNTFITDSISQVNSALATNSVKGVDTGYVHTSPSASRDIIIDATASVLTSMATDHYPETVTDTTGTACGTAMHNELAAYVTGQHSGKRYHLTIGPNVNVQLSSSEQVNAYNSEWGYIQTDVVPLDGLTVWQSGGTGDPLSRLFDYASGAWTPRSAAATVNTIFGQVPQGQLSEKVTPELINNINVFDTSSILENVTVQVPIAATLTISVFEASTVTDVITQILKIDLINVFDASTVTDVVTQILEIDFVNVFDGSTVTDVITQILQIYTINVFDSSIVTDVITQILQIYNINVFDNPTVTDVPTVLLPYLIISVSDSSTVTDVLTQVLQIYNINASDASTVTDVIVQVLETYNINTSDASTVTDVVVQVLKIDLINTSDASTITDVVIQALEIDFVNVFDNPSVTDVPTIFLPYLTISLFEASTATDVITQILETYNINVFDNSTVTDVITQVLEIDFVNVFDSSIVTDVVTQIAIFNTISVFDNSAVTDVITQILETHNINVFDTSIVTDVVAQILEIDFVNVFDASTVTDVVTQVLQIYDINVFDASTTTDVIIQILETYNINVFDASAATENLTVLIPILYINIFDASTITESLTIEAIDDGDIVDSSTVSEFIAIDIPVILSVFDSSTVNDNLSWAASFDGVNGTIGKSSFSLSQWNARSFSAWVRTTSLASTNNIQGYGVAGNPRMGFQILTTGKLQMEMQSLAAGTSGLRISTSSSNLVPIRTWTHVAYVVQELDPNTNRSINDVDLYVNGVKQTKGSSGIGQATGTQTQFNVGSYTTAATFFTGEINDVQVYNRTLSDQEITDIYNNQATTNGLILNWPLDTGTGTTAIDTSGNSNNGTFAGGVTWVEDGQAPTAQVVEVDTITPFDSSTITDVVTQVLLKDSVSVFDNSTVTDVPTVALVDLINVFEASTVTDVVTQVLKINNINVFDSSTVTDPLTQILLTNFINVTETSGVTDVLTQILKFEIIAPIENIGATDVTGYALYFGSNGNGSGNTRLDLGTLPAAFQNLTAVTVEAWVYITATPTQLGRVFDYQLTTTTGYVMWTASASPVRISFVVGNGTTQPTANTGTLNLNQWYHIAGTWDGSLVRTFVNGTLANSATLSGGDTGSGTRSGLIGNTASARQFPGIIKELRVSNIARYTANFTAPTAEFTNDANTLVLLHMNDASGATATDSSSSGLNGTLLGTPLPQWIASSAPINPFAGQVEIIDFVSLFDTSGVTESVTVEIPVNNTVFDASVVTEFSTVMITDFISPSDSSIITENFGYALHFDGIDDWITLGVSGFESQIATQGLYIKMQIRSTASAATFLYGDRAVGNGGMTLSAVFNGTYGQNIVNFGLQDNTGANRNGFLVKDVLDGQTHIIEVTYLVSGVNSNFLSISVDGVSTGFVDGSGQGQGNTTYDTFQVGFDPTGSNGAFDCDYLLLGHSNGITTTKTAEFLINDGHSTTITDITGNGNTGTIVDATWTTPLTNVTNVEIVNLVPVFDVSTVTDTIIQVLNIYNLVLSDASIVSENITIEILDSISQFDASTVSENIAVEILDEESLFDTSTVTEFSAVELLNLISISDSSITTDILTQILEIDNVNVFDSSIATEFSSVLIPILYISVGDDPTVSESVGANTIISLSIFDSSVATDFVSQVLVTSLVSVTDNSTITESVSIAPFLIINPTEDSVVTDIVIVEILDEESLFDTSTVTEFSQVIIVNLVNQNDSSIVTDVLTRILEIYCINKVEVSLATDTLTGQNGGIWLNPLDITVFEALGPYFLIFVDGRPAIRLTGNFYTFV
jgi:hypothetical protein